MDILEVQRQVETKYIGSKWDLNEIISLTGVVGSILWRHSLLVNVLGRFGGRQIHASEDDGLVNHALVRDLEADAVRLEQFGSELEAD